MRKHTNMSGRLCWVPHLLLRVYKPSAPQGDIQTHKLRIFSLTTTRAHIPSSTWPTTAALETSPPAPLGAACPPQDPAVALPTPATWSTPLPAALPAPASWAPLWTLASRRPALSPSAARRAALSPSAARRPALSPSAALPAPVSSAPLWTLAARRAAVSPSAARGPVWCPVPARSPATIPGAPHPTVPARGHMLALWALGPEAAAPWPMDLEAATQWGMEIVASDPSIVESMASLPWVMGPDIALQSILLLDPANLVIDQPGDQASVASAVKSLTLLCLSILWSYCFPD